MSASTYTDIAGLDAGIAPWVHILLGQGIETFESCQGGGKHAFTEPTIRFHGQAGDGVRAYAIARTYGWPVQAIRRVWNEIDGELTGPIWEIVFWKDALGYAPTDSAATEGESDGERAAVFSRWQQGHGDG